MRGAAAPHPAFRVALRAARAEGGNHLLSNADPKGSPAGRQSRPASEFAFGELYAVALQLLHSPPWLGYRHLYNGTINDYLSLHLFAHAAL